MTRTTPEQLHRAVLLLTQIEILKGELTNLLTGKATPAKPVRRKRRQPIPSRAITPLG